jgi:hypothetical protein
VKLTYTEEGDMPEEPLPEAKKDGEEDEAEGMDPAMAAMMGFGGFGTTKVSSRP